MGYMHINNLYKDQRVLMFKEVYVLEKVHGTSAHVSYIDGRLNFHSGGASHASFLELFDQEALLAKFQGLGAQRVVVYGEAYGGKMQKMSGIYGAELRFIAFDICINDSWLDVPRAAQLAADLGFEFVPWEQTEATVEKLNAIRDRPSEVAARRGCGNDKEREGIVIKPLMELRTNNDERLMAKHKGDKFEERMNPPRVTPDKAVVLSEAKAVADEWVTEMRLGHVLDKLETEDKRLEIQDTPAVMNAMLEDVYREAKGEIVESKDVERAIKQAAAALFKARLKAVLK